MGLANKNVEWIDGRGTWWFYLFALGCARYFCFLCGFDIPTSWTLVIVSHSVITFWIVHFKRGSLLTWDDDAGKFDDMTYWEQIDQGVLNTSNRKFLIIVPLILLFIAYRNTHGNMLLVSVAFSAAILVPKIPLFGGLFKQKRRTLTRPSSYTELFSRAGFHTFRSAENFPEADLSDDESSSQDPGSMEGSFENQAQQDVDAQPGADADKKHL